MRLAKAWLPLVFSITGACGQAGADSPPGQSSAGQSAGGQGGSSASNDASPTGGSAGSAGGGSGGTAVGGSAGSGQAGSGGNCSDGCPAPNGGVSYRCQKRFMYGMNYAWHSFGADFGGITSWNARGISAQAAVHDQKLSDMAAHGASVVRWWVFPDLRGDGIAFGPNDLPTGLGGTALVDLAKALELAQKNDVYLMLCLFSFDAFRPGATNSGLWVPGLAPIVKDSQKRTALLEQVLRPFVRAAATSPNADRVISWDVINEPEWAMSGKSPHGDPDYAPISGLETLTHAEMEGFVKNVISLLRSESKALVTVGGTAMKWGHAWTGVDVDFYQVHMYDWTNQLWPYTDPPSKYGLVDKPLVIGEFPMDDLVPGVSYAKVVSSLWATGYAGALSWQYDNSTPAGLAAVAAFAATHPCETRYGSGSPRWVTAPEAARVRIDSQDLHSLRFCRVEAGRPDCSR